ncbi:MAG: hypothetical protein ACKO96_05515, partial [Flammeovirgaceae bacterium]
LWLTSYIQLIRWLSLATWGHVALPLLLKNEALVKWFPGLFGSTVSFVFEQLDEVVDDTLKSIGERAKP